ncbi:MAG: DNA mismatch repair protein MutS [bacterium]
MLRQYRNIKAQYPDAILMFRLGDFYEMFYDDAVIAAKLLDITLTSRNKNDPNPIPLCGVPYHSVEPYIAKLLENGRKIAICDQVEDPRLAKGVVKRAVTRVLTPGVITDGLGLDAGTHNFLASISMTGEKFGLAIADASTGFFQASEFDSAHGLIEELCRTEPKELILPQNAGGELPDSDTLLRRIPSLVCTILPQQDFSATAIEVIEGGANLSRELPAGASAAGGILSYLKSTQMGRLGNITSIARRSDRGLMHLDESSKRNLELVRTLRENEREGSLLWAIDRTSTAAGARAIRRWLLYPLTDVSEISARQGAVEKILNDVTLLRRVPDLLSHIYDIERIAARAAIGNASPRDLCGLKESLAAASELRALVEGKGGLLGDLACRIDPCADLICAISSRLVDEPPAIARDGGIIREGVSAELDELRGIIAHGKDTIARIEATEREATGISSLKVKFNKVFGYYLEVTNSNRSRVPQHYIRKQTLANAERFITPELKEYEEKVLGAEERVKAMELMLFAELREQVAQAAARIQRTAASVASIDALASLARIAAEYDYVKPEVDGALLIDIREGRHPIVERMQSAERFVPNDVRLDGGESRFLMITGPNMAGKSTVMRQTALIVLMAQIGSFVPATSARIGVVDRIFTRVGASDALSQGRSTFMVEMSEASVILRSATERSLVIIDEIGRGTSTFDGLAIAWAVAEDLHDRVRCRTMFATHYHELTDLALTKTGIANHQIAVREWNGQVIFLRRLLPGATSRSYGIAVAKLAGLPDGVIDRATEVLKNLEEGELDEVGKPRIASSHGDGQAAKDEAQYRLFAHPKSDEVMKRLKSIDATAMTPIEALNILHDLATKIRS